MLNEQKNIDSLFKNGLKNHEEEFSTSVWENISQKLAENATFSSQNTAQNSIDQLFNLGLANHEEEFSASVWENISQKLDENAAFSNQNTAQTSIDQLFKQGLANHGEEFSASVWENISQKLDENAAFSNQNTAQNASQTPIDLLFKNGLAQHEEAIPPFVWQNVAQNIDAYKTKRRLFYIRTLAASIAILLSFTAGLLFTNYEKDNFTALNEPENDIDLVEIPTTDIRHSIKELIHNVKKIETTKKLAQATFDNSQLSQDIDNLAYVSCKKPDVTLVLAQDVQVDLEAINKSKFSKASIIAQSRDTFGLQLTSKVMERKTYTTTATYNPNNYKLVPTSSNIELSKSKNKSAWFVGGYFSPVFSYRFAQTNADYAEPRRASADGITKEIQDKDFYDEKEQGTYSFASGISVEYKTKSRWALLSGIYITTLGQANGNISQDLITDIQQQTYIITTSAGSISVNDSHNFSAWKQPESQLLENKPQTVELLQNFEYVEVPLNLKYNFVNNISRVSVSFVAGISTNVLLKNRVFLQSETQKYEIGKTNNINKFIYNSNLGLGFAYKFGHKVYMNVEPSFKYSLVPLNKNYPIYYRPYYFTIFTGLSYKF